VVVTSRSQSGLPMSWMRMQDELLEIDSTALRFDMAESENFLVKLGGLDLDYSDVEELTVKTDGWIAALQLASLSLRGCEDPARLIGTMTGRHHAISEFLADNVLDTLEPSMLDFLLATSITERICGDLASALAGVAGRATDARTGRGTRPVPAPDRRAVVPLSPAVPRVPAAPTRT
jgi:serine/threonine-protein kinase PknK